MNDTELLHFKLEEFRASLKEEIRKLSASSDENLIQYENRIKEIASESLELREKIKKIRESAKSNKGKILAIARKIKAVDQIL